MNFERTKRSVEYQPLMNEELAGYTYEEAMAEANRCIQCKHRPCSEKGCVANLPIPEFIKAFRDGDIEEARRLIDTKSTLTSVCSRVCFQANQCEGACTLGIKGESIAIGLLERYIADHSESTYKKNEELHKSVGIIGSGPAGLACAKELLSHGVNVDIYESSELAGGVLRYGIPNYRLPNSITDEYVAEVETLGGRFILNSKVTLDDIKDKYDAVFMGNGASIPMTMGAINEEHEDVLSAFEVLAAINEVTHPKHQEMMNKFNGKVVKVVGGGNVAMDVSRSVARLNPKSVSIVYRRSIDELPARKEEVEDARIDGVNFELLINPFEFVIEDNHLVGAKCRQMQLGELDDSGRRSVSEIPNSEIFIPCDYMIIAIGSSVEKLSEEIATDRRNRIQTSDNQATNVANVYAGGDAVNGPLTVVHAMRQGKEAAEAMINNWK
ncbi:MAG: FAD-dependent oxidoreductase [Erysipelotrichales bacterium]|nr:FAD-dependent oxidoreductase [Erysipelotrichales bacterium]